MIAYYKKVINWQQFDDRSGRNVIIISFINSLSGGHRKPLGSRRRQLEWMTNFILLVVSLFGVTVGAGLLGFYKIHLLTFLSVEFLVLPMVLLGMRIQLNYRTFHNIINFICSPSNLSLKRWYSYFTGGGLFTLFVSMIGLVATSRRSPCLLRFYAFMLLVAFLVLLGGITCSVKVYSFDYKMAYRI